MTVGGGDSTGGRRVGQDLSGPPRADGDERRSPVPRQARGPARRRWPGRGAGDRTPALGGRADRRVHEPSGACSRGRDGDRRSVAASSAVDDHEGLTNLDYGVWEGLTKEECAAHDPEAFRLYAEEPETGRLPRRRGRRVAADRIVDALREIGPRHPGESIAAVTHGAMVRLAVLRDRRPVDRRLAVQAADGIGDDLRSAPTASCASSRRSTASAPIRTRRRPRRSSRRGGGLVDERGSDLYGERNDQGHRASSPAAAASSAATSCATCCSAGSCSVRAVDVKPLDEWYQVARRTPRTSSLDLSRPRAPATGRGRGAREVYNLAADMGGMGFIENNKALCMLSVLINTHMLHGRARRTASSASSTRRRPASTPPTSRPTPTSPRSRRTTPTRRCPRTATAGRSSSASGCAGTSARTSASRRASPATTTSTARTAPATAAARRRRPRSAARSSRRKLTGDARDRDLGRRRADPQLHVHRRLRPRHRSDPGTATSSSRSTSAATSW